MMAGSGGELAPEALKAEMAAGAALVLLDVREPDEFRQGRLPDAVHIPLDDLAVRMGELDREREIVVYCRSGRRSAMACRWLRQAGFPRVRNLAGGILAWGSEE